MIYGVRQFRLGQGQIPKPKSDTVKCLDCNGPNPYSLFYKTNRQFFVGCNDCVKEICIARMMDRAAFDVYVQYLCGLWCVRDVFWRMEPYTFTSVSMAPVTNAIGAFVVDGDFDYGVYEEM